MAGQATGPTNAYKGLIVINGNSLGPQRTRQFKMKVYGPSYEEIKEVAATLAKKLVFTITKTTHLIPTHQMGIVCIADVGNHVWVIDIQEIAENLSYKLIAGK